MVNDHGCAQHTQHSNSTSTLQKNDGWERFNYLQQCFHRLDRSLNEKVRRLRRLQAWVASLIAITVISFGSLIGILAFRGKQRAAFPYVLIFMVALGLSVLLGDSLLHLLPHSLGLHNHGKNEHGHADAHNHSDPYRPDNPIWKSLLFLAGVYVFIIFELTMKMCLKDRGNMHMHTHATEPRSLKYEVEENGIDKAVENGSSSNHMSIADLDKPTKLTMKDIQAVAWMILLGDGVHNFMDGVAIGAAFSEPFPNGLRGGIMTSIAIMIHEIPHELGDFAVLISSGLSLPQAFCLNLLSSLTAFIGGIVGILLGVNWNASPWIFAFTGGLFVYISLVDMLPEVMNNPLMESSPKVAFPLALLGVTMGFLIMFFIAVYEHDILTALN